MQGSFNKIQKYIVKNATAMFDGGSIFKYKTILWFLYFNQFVEDTKKQNGIISDAEENYNHIEKNALEQKSIIDILVEKVSELTESNNRIIDSVQTISGISEETMANTEQTDSISCKNLEVVKTIRDLSDELHSLSMNLG